MFFLLLFQIIIGFYVIINANKGQSSLKRQPLLGTYASRKLKQGKSRLASFTSFTSFTSFAPDNEKSNAFAVINALATGNISQIIGEFKDVHQKRGGNDPIISKLIGQLESSI